MSDDATHNEPSQVKADVGKVIVTGPDGVDVRLTPEAAVKTGAKLIDAAAEAKGKADMEADLAKRREGRGPAA